MFCSQANAWRKCNRCFMSTLLCFKAMRYQSFCLMSISRLTGMELLYCQVESMFVSHVNGSGLTKHVINRPGFLLAEPDSLTFRNLTPRPGDSYWVLYCIYNTCWYWVYPIFTKDMVVFPIQYNIIIFFGENSGILRKVIKTGEK